MDELSQISGVEMAMLGLTQRDIDAARELMGEQVAPRVYEAQTTETINATPGTETPIVLDLAGVRQVLRQNMVEVGPDDDDNPVVIARRLGLIGLTEVEITTAGYYDRVDQSRMITHGRLIEAVGHGQRVLQATTLSDTIH